jgi:hypothetical protein
MTVPSRSTPARAKARTLFAAAAVASAAAVALAVPAAASAATAQARSAGTAAGPAVFVQTDNTAGNQVVAYVRASDGTLTPDDLTPQMQDEFIALYRQWHADRPTD